MAIRENIITVGISPAWDVKCQVAGLDWGDHKVIDTQNSIPAGKALNVSKALAWMGYPSIASGLWGQEDYDEMVEQLKPVNCLIDIRFAAVRGHTRKNITIHDTHNHREMHLRLPGSLANKGSLKRLRSHLETMTGSNDIVIFAGSLPDGALMPDVVEIVRSCASRGGKVIVDTSGQGLKTLAASGAAYLISPNIEELCELVGTSVRNEVYAIEKAARKLLNETENVFVSRGKEGVLLVTKSGSWSGQCEPAQARKKHNAVGCGDYLLAGLIAGLEEKGNLPEALENALMLAAAHTFGLCDEMEWWQACDLLEVQIEKI